MIGASEVILFLFIPVLVFLIVFWLWMLIDCLKRQDGMFKFGGNNARLIWILVIILTGVIGAVIYYFLIKKTDSHEDRIIGIALLASLATIVILIASGLMVNTRSTVSIEPYPPGKLPQSIEIPTISLTPKVTPVLPPINQTLPSNATTIPTIMAIQPDTGTIGTKVVITGTGFTARDNNVAFRLEPEDSPGTFKVGYINNLVSRDGKIIEFIIPEVLGACAFPLPETNPVTACPAIGILFKPGTQTYPVYVVNQNGTSNRVNFTVSR